MLRELSISCQYKIADAHSPKFTKRTQAVPENAARKYKTNPGPRNLQRLERRLVICTIFIRALAAGGIRGSDVVGKIGEMPPATKEAALAGC